jgi:hypothetical protein
LHADAMRFTPAICQRSHFRCNCPPGCFQGISFPPWSQQTEGITVLPGSHPPAFRWQ